MIKIDIKNWLTGKINFTAEIDCQETDSQPWKFGLAVKWAIKNKADLQGANLQGANLQWASLQWASLQGANLRAADLQGANLRAADLQGANLQGASLQGASLQGANLRAADLRAANLRAADLQGANLRAADLQGADLQGASLQGASLQGANLRAADLQGANLQGAYNEKILLVGERPIIQIGPIGSRKDYLSAYFTDKGVLIQAGCWTGNLDEFDLRVTKQHANTKIALEYFAAIHFLKTQEKIWGIAI